MVAEFAFTTASTQGRTTRETSNSHVLRRCTVGDGMPPHSTGTEWTRRLLGFCSTLGQAERRVDSPARWLSSADHQRLDSAGHYDFFAVAAVSGHPAAGPGHLVQ